MSLSVMILTGQSGSGKSTALRALEDQGFLCVDNMPADLAEDLILTIEKSSHIEQLVLVIDVREPGQLKEAPTLIRRLRRQSRPVRLIYFEAQSEALVRRYSQTRRRHPLDHGEGLRQSILREREILVPLRELADGTIDTTALSPHALRRKTMQQLVGEKMRDDLCVALMSFGFKFGIPLDADLVLDVRFLQNPYFVSELRELTGLDESVRRYVLADGDTGEFMDRTFAYLSYLLPRFQREGKRYLTVAIGCTGGRHRSVTVVHSLEEMFRGQGLPVDVIHRDVKELQV